MLGVAFWEYDPSSPAFEGQIETSGSRRLRTEVDDDMSRVQVARVVRNNVNRREPMKGCSR